MDNGIDTKLYRVYRFSDYMTVAYVEMPAYMDDVLSLYLSKRIAQIISGESVFLISNQVYRLDYDHYKYFISLEKWTSYVL